MDKELLEIAAKSGLTKDVHQAFLLVLLGAQTPFDIQEQTGWRIGRAEAAWEDTCKIFAQVTKVTYAINKYNKATVRSTGAKSLHHISCDLLTLLYGLLDRPIPRVFPARDQKAMHQALNLALRFTGNDYTGSAELLQDYILIDLDKLAQSDYPAPYLATCFRSYLAKVPKKPRDVIERELQLGSRMGYNYRTKKWERINGRTGTGTVKTSRS